MPSVLKLCSIFTLLSDLECRMSFCCHGGDDNDSHRRAFDESKGIVGIRVRGPVVVCFALQVSLQRAEVACEGE